MHGKTWLDVVGDTLRAYVVEQNPKNKKQDKEAKEVKAKDLWQVGLRFDPVRTLLGSGLIISPPTLYPPPWEPH